MRSEFSAAGMYLHALRIKAGLTQIELSKKINVHPQFVSNWERGTCMPPKHCLKQMAKALKISNDDKKNIFEKIKEDLLIQVSIKFKGIV